ncbi:MAG: sulfatase, partial [bacterium]
DQAIAPAPWTLPTHASVFTGRRPGVLSLDWLYPLPDNGPRTVAEVLRDNGYLTAGFVSNHFYTSYESGLERGFTHYDDYRTSLRLILANSAYGRSDFFNQIIDRRTLRGVASAVRHLDFRRAIRPSHVPRLAPAVTAAFLDWQKESGDRPFFAFINYMGGHKPYRSDPTWIAKFKSTPTQKTDEYDAAIARLDHEVGRILDTLERRGVLKNTLVIFAADHGEHFGEHGLEEHGNSLYRELLEVPLVMSMPSRIPAGQRVGAMVSLRDVGATILDVTGNATGPRFPGSSLAQYWSATPPTAGGSILSELTMGVNVDKNFRNRRGGLQSLIDSRFHYIHNDVGDEELYERGTDSAEARNLAKDPAMRGEMERLRRELAAARSDVPDQPQANSTPKH